MNRYYKHADESTSDAFLAAVNSHDVFDGDGIIGSTGGKTTCWAEKGKEMLSGEWAIPAIPEERIVPLGITQSERDAILEAYNTEVVELTAADFPAKPTNLPWLI